MEPLISSVQQLAEQADEAQRKKLIDTLNGLALSIESPQDMMQRLLYMHVYISVARVACDLQIFNHVADSLVPVAASDIAARTGAAPNLVARILRYLASVGALAETEEDTYTANNTTKTLANPAWQGAIYHNFDFAWPCFLALPDFLKETGYKDINDPTHCPFNKGHNSDKSAFEWLPQQPGLFPKFNQFMTVQREGMPKWLDKFPYIDYATGVAKDRPVFVDIGGGVGHQSALLRAALPESITNPIIVQDLEAVVAQTAPVAGIQHTAHDFWQPQPVKGARMYYMRNIMHDWPDDKAVIILRHTRDAMDHDSVLLIDEMVVPKTGAHWQATQLDMMMMSALGACERSQTQWETLMASAGLQIKQFHQYTKSLNDCIIECELL